MEWREPTGSVGETIAAMQQVNYTLTLGEHTLVVQPGKGKRLTWDRRITLPRPRRKTIEERLVRPWLGEEE